MYNKNIFAVRVTKTVVKLKLIYNGYWVVADGAGSWTLDYLFAKNVMIFDIENSSLRHSGSHKNSFLVSTEGSTNHVNNSIHVPGDPRKCSVLILLIQKPTFLDLHCNDD